MVLHFGDAWYNEYTNLATPAMLTQVEELPEAASRTIAAEWGTQTAGGSHIHPDWKKNPCFHLKLRTTGPAKVSKRLPISNLVGMHPPIRVHTTEPWSYDSRAYLTVC